MCDEEESPRVRQENEFEVLQAIFMEDIKDLRSNDAWKIDRPPEFLLTLFPQQSSGGQTQAHVKVDLRVKCPVDYPNRTPTISLENAKGISTQNIYKLEIELNTIALNYRGQEMILQLAQHVQMYLHQNKKPTYNSCYEEMMFRQKQLEEEQARALREKEELLRKKEDIERKAIEEEVAKRQEALKEERRLATGAGDGLATLMSSPTMRADRELSPIVEPGAVNYVGLRQSVAPRRQRWSSKSESYSSQESHSCDQVGVVTIKFSNRIERTVQQGRCLGHSSHGSVVYAGMDANTGELVTITEWVLKWRHVGRRPSVQDLEAFQKESTNYIKQLSNIEQELLSLSKLQHKNLVHYLGMKYYLDKDRIVVLILQEFVTGGNLSYHLSENIPVDYELLQHYILGILEALSYLHRNSVVHKDIRDTSVFIENRGLIRLADYSLDKRLSELCAVVNKDVNTENPFFPPSVGRGGKKGDIYRLGILCLSLANGEIVTAMYPEVQSSLPATLKSFLEKCLTRNEQERWTADSLLDHPFMKPSIGHEPSPDKNFVDKEKRPDEDGEDPQPEIQISMLIDPNRQSRLHNEFEILKWLGRGGFGDVFKVKNKLDGGIYAIKRIKLNPNNKQLNRKITREVKLLSRLNHENVVRYFNSWLETAPMDDLPKNSDCESESECSDSMQKSQVEANKNKIIDQTNGNNEHDSPSTVDGSVDWSASCVGRPEDEESTSDEEEEDIYGTSFLHRLGESSESVIFDDDAESNANQDQTCPPKSNKSEKPFREPSPRDGSGSRLVQLMYIQMELCERSTLRDTIDNGLHQDSTRVWRLFREMVEGLSHIHQQGMIHRDLKPVNIFLDSHDQVKIGDFGLATTNILAVNELFGSQRESARNTERDVSQSEGVSDGNLTGWVGTKLYTSPEVANPPARPVYNQKVDIYSLGIIFFEMCYQPLTTAMERVIILENLRKPEIIFPADFVEDNRSQQVSIIRWLLSHDPALRPTSQELLESSYLPPPQMEEAKLQDMLRHTISNPQSKIYKHMISTLFQQETSTAANVTYDIDMHKGSFHSKSIIIQKHVTDSIEKVFRRHGAINVSTPLLTPGCCGSNEHSEFCVHLVDHGGGVVSLPQNLRVPFCRFVVKNKVTQLKRYHMAPVFRERKIYGCHPRTIYECAFDIVTPTPGSLIPDAEVLNVIWEIVSEFQPLQERHCVVRLNHTSLLKGILLCCGIPEESHSAVYKILNDSRAENLSKYQVQVRLSGLDLPEQAIQALFKRFEMEGPLSKIAETLKPLMRRQQHPSATLLRQGISELETIVNNAVSMGLKASVVVAPNLVYSIHHFSGIVFQFVCELRKKHKKEGLEVLAAGGRYDQLLGDMRTTMGVSGSRDVGQSAVGLSMAIEKLVAALMECEDFVAPGAFDVVVCSMGNQTLLKQKSAIVHDLRNAGISAHVHYDSLQSFEDIQELCRENLAYYMIILKENETTSVRVRCWDKDKLFDKKVSTGELVDFLAQKGLTNRSESFDSQTQTSYKIESNKIERSLSESVSTNPQLKCSTTFLTEDKLAPNVKRRQEGQMMSHLYQVIQQFSPKLCVEVIAVELTSQVLKSIATHIELDGNEKEFSASVGVIIEKHQRHRKYLNKICDLIHHFRFDKQQPVLILYGLTDGSYKVLM